MLTHVHLPELGLQGEDMQVLQARVSPCVAPWVGLEIGEGGCSKEHHSLHPLISSFIDIPCPTQCVFTVTPLRKEKSMTRHKHRDLPGPF